MRASNRRAQPGSIPEATVAMWVGIVVVALVLIGAEVSVKLGHRLAGIEQSPTDPFVLFFGVLDGSVAWPTESTVVAVVFGMLLLGLVLLVWRWRHRRNGAGSRGSRVDRAARYMGVGADLAPLTRRTCTATAQRLAVVADTCGVYLGTSVVKNTPLYASWEDTQIDIWGPRTGKTTSRAIPAILDAPGAVIATSNKRDVLDATRDIRGRRGRVWVFDPQQVALEQPTWWWNPLSYVTDETKAATLAEHFASGSREPDARADSYFDPAAKDLLAGLLLAAALDNHPITTVNSWLTRPTDDTAVEILTRHHYPMTADRIAEFIAAPDKQRAGVYGLAQQMTTCLDNRSLHPWITPQGPGERRPEFNPHHFLASHDTLFSLSREGHGTAGPLVTALTVAVIEAAETRATTQPGGRLSTPLLAVLDEAANVCRWRELPNLYSHYGSRGIILMTILQSWSQGVAVWGEPGMKKLWSAANIKVFGGGVDEDSFLRHLSQVIGDYDAKHTSLNTSKNGRQISHQLHREPILDVAALASLPRGRAIVFASGTRPILIRTTPWMDTPHAREITASLSSHTQPQEHPNAG